MKTFTLSVFLLFTFASFLALPARTLHIPADFEAIQNGIDSAQAGDTILIQPGRYIENIDFSGKAIVVGGRFMLSNDSADIDSVVIDGNQNGAPAVMFSRGEDEGSVLTGLTITNALADYGGGVYVRGASPALTHLVIRDNWTNRTGGGIHCTGGARPTLRNLTLLHNQSRTGGGGISVYNRAHPTLVKVRIFSNSNAGTGGAILVSGNGSLTLDSCVVSGNAGFYGGVLAVTLSPADTVAIRRTLIASNSAGARCSILYGNGGTVSFEQVTFADNFQGQLQMETIGSHLIFHNSILWNIDAGGLVVDNINISYCDIQGGREALVIPDSGLVWGEGNIDAEPLFADAETGDYHLTWASFPAHDQFKSPCIDNGNPDSPMDPDSTRADIGAYYFDQLNVSLCPQKSTPADEFKLLSVYPNPFNQRTTITYLLPSVEKVKLSIFDGRGRVVKAWDMGILPPGLKTWVWEAGGQPSGAYMAVLNTPTGSLGNRLILCR